MEFCLHLARRRGGSVALLVRSEKDIGVCGEDI